MPVSRLSAALGCVLASTAGAPALAQAGPIAFHIPAGGLDRALDAYARQSGRPLLVEHALVAPLRSAGLAGRYTADDALTRLLAGAGLQAVPTGTGGVIVRRAAAPSPAPTSAPAPTPPTGDLEPAPPASTQVSDVVVTGTFIRGAPPSSPVEVITRAAMDRAGQATVADALSALPQNFGGVSTPQTALLGTDGLGTNFGLSTGVNLRGLGATSTLVLVNGRRMAGSGLQGDFADVSAIPTAAVDRVEVLLDGASALYGSDAVGGVVNVILKHDFDGAETRLRYGGATDSGDENVIASQTFGHTWDGGRILLSYEYQDQGRLRAADRPFTADQDLRALGGSDHRVIYAHPGNILAYDPASGGYVGAYAIPAATSAAPTAADFTAGTENLENSRALADTLPAQNRQSVYLSAAQSLNTQVELSLDARYTRRSYAYNFPEPLSVFEVDGSNPHYVAPDGAPYELIGYAFGDETGPTRNKGTAENFGVSAGATAHFAHDWRLDVYGSLAQDQERTLSLGLVNSGFLDEALGVAPDDPATPFSAARDGYFNPFGTNIRQVLDFVSSGTSDSRTLSRLETLDARADGPLWRLPGGLLRVALGVEARRESFVTATVSYTTGAVPEDSGGQVFRRSVLSGYAELSVPIFGTPNARPGLRRLELSLAGRVESYSDVGISGTPKVGVLWSPAQGVSLRATYAQSFRAPTLTEVDAQQVIAPAFAARGSQEVLSLIEYGGDPNLRAETATSWTAGLDWKPDFLPGFTGSLGWFDIDYRDRIGQPVLEDFANALQNPDYAQFVTLVDPTHSASDAALVQSLLARSVSASASLFPASSYGAVIDARYVNAAQSEVSGFDAQGAYTLQLRADRLDAAFNATLLTDDLRRLTASAEPDELAGKTGYPARLRLRSSLGWTHGETEATLGVNHVNGSRALGGGRVDGWTTMDVELGWRPTTARLRGLVITLTAQNLLDADPPFYDAPNGVGYDPANADALGRVMALQVSRRW